MKALICLAAALLVLTTAAAAAEVPEDLARAAPEAAEGLPDGDLSGGTGLAEGIGAILSGLADRAGDVVRERTRGAAAILLIAVLCGALEGFAGGTGGKNALPFLPMAGALSVTLASAGSLDTLLGLGRETIGELSDFSTVLLPTLAAATAAGGAVTTATVQQVSAVFFVDLLLRLIRGVLLPLVYLYGRADRSRLSAGGAAGCLAAGLKKPSHGSSPRAAGLHGVSLPVRVISGTADSAAVKLTKAASPAWCRWWGASSPRRRDGAGRGGPAAGLHRRVRDAGGAGGLRLPFLQLGVQYLLYKGTAYLASVVGAPGLCKLIDGLGGAFGLILGMTGSCALLLLISVLASVGAVMP